MEKLETFVEKHFERTYTRIYSLASLCLFLNDSRKVFREVLSKDGQTVLCAHVCKKNLSRLNIYKHRYKHTVGAFRANLSSLFR